MKGDYSPLNLNCLGALIQNQGLAVPERVYQEVGTYNKLTDKVNHGNLVAGSFFLKLADAIRLAYDKIGNVEATDITPQQFLNLTNIGHASIPLLGNSAPATYIDNKASYTQHDKRFGFLSIFAYQAWTEMYINNGTYSDFLSTISTCIAFKNKSNKVIRSLHKSQYYLDGIYSNMNDLVTADITGVNLSTFFWGQDLIRLGRSLDLENIDKFGLPSVLLKTLYKNNGITKALSLALLTAGISPTELTNIINSEEVSIDQERTILASFFIIMGPDLEDVCTILNCQIPNLETLADLLDLKKLFPYSYQALTVPQYNSIKLPTNSKTYYLIYKDGEVDMGNSLGFGDRLINVLPEKQAFACDAFSLSMMQIKAIKKINIEKFSQVVSNLEIVSDLNVNGTNIPTDVTSINPAFKDVAKGSGNLHMYCTSDFFASMTDYVYPWNDLQAIINYYNNSGNVMALRGTYENIFNCVSGPAPYYALSDLIDNANAQIRQLQLDNPQLADMANKLYDFFGNMLAIEQNARDAALGDTTTYQSGGTNEIYSFMDVLYSYSLDTKEYETAQFLENIADLNTVGGRSLIGSMREYRNATRLGLAGIELDNGVDYEEFVVPKPTGTKPNSGTSFPSFTSAGQLKDVTIVTGAATTPGSLGGSPETQLIPSNLNLLDMVTAATVLPPEEAVHSVTICNCDCWDLLDHR